MFLNFLNHAPFGVAVDLVIFPHALPPVRCKDLSLLIWYLQALWAVSLFFDSLAALFQGTYPEISSGGAPQTFVHTVSFGLTENQSKFEPDKNQWWL